MKTWLSKTIMDFNLVYACTSSFVGYTGKIVVEYTKTTDVVLSSISVSKNPDKIKYIYGEEGDLDLTGGQITATYSDGTTAILDMVTDGTILPGLKTSGYDLDVAGMQSVIITYTEGKVSKSESFNIVVETTLESIFVKTLPTKLVYSQGETLDKTGLAVRGRYSDGSTYRLSGYTCSPMELNTLGTQTITVTYTEDGNTFTTTFDVTVQ